MKIKPAWTTHEDEVARTEAGVLMKQSGIAQKRAEDFLWYGFKNLNSNFDFYDISRVRIPQEIDITVNENGVTTTYKTS